MLCWINGQYVDDTEIMISPFDHGFLYGLGFYETFRTYSGKVVLLEEHFNRLCSALNLYRINIPYTLKEIQEAIYELTRSMGEDAIIRLNVSAGYNSLSIPYKYESPNVILFQTPLIKRKRNTEKAAQWLQIRRVVDEHHCFSFRSNYFGNNVLARFEIEDLTTTEGFFLTSKGFIADGITSNIFWARDGILYTPSISTGIIPGITRQWSIMIARRLGYRVVEDVFIKKELENAYECFITNSIEELVPISNIEKIHFLGENGPMYQRLHQAYIEEIIQTVKRG